MEGAKDILLTFTPDGRLFKLNFWCLASACTQMQVCILFPDDIGASVKKAGAVEFLSGRSTAMADMLLTSLLMLMYVGGCHVSAAVCLQQFLPRHSGRLGDVEKLPDTDQLCFTPCSNTRSMRLHSGFPCWCADKSHKSGVSRAQNRVSTTQISPRCTPRSVEEPCITCIGPLCSTTDFNGTCKAIAIGASQYVHVRSGRSCLQQAQRRRPADFWGLLA